MSILRGKAWRRFQNKVNSNKGMGSEDKLKPEKNWKMLYFRSNKLARSKQLGFEYPRKNTRQLLEMEYITND